MAKRVVSVKLGSGSIGDAITKLREYKTWSQRKATELARRLAELGEGEAKVRFAGAEYDGEKDVSIKVKQIPGGYSIQANGSAVFFIEFGAGVYYNGSEPYPEPRPSGIVGIGEYGQGKGKQKAWGFYDSSGELVITHGTPAAMPMLRANSLMRQNIERIAKEVFSGD